ncbi:MAG TPA: hypothetical protein VGH20_04910 [Myxococcales bacterium]|jgi:hypothetical protein
MTGIAFLIAIVAAVLAVVFWFQYQSASGAVTGLKAAHDEARKESELARVEQRKAEAELKARTAQLQETREKLNEVRKKTQEGKPKIQQPRGVREAELEEDLAHARKLTEEAHASEAAARRDLSTARSTEAQIRGELSAAQDRLRALSQQPAPAAPVAESPIQQQLADELAQQRKQLEAARSELERQVQQAERNSREAKRRETELRDEVRKMRGRAETNNRVYLVTKGELEVTKERLAQAERKLWQAGIPLAPVPSKERPKAKGPAAVDRPRDEGSTQPAEGASEGASSEISAASSASPAPQGDGEHTNGAPEALLAGAGEPIAAPESVAAPEAAVPPSLTPSSGSAPIRRRPTEGVADKPR